MQFTFKNGMLERIVMVSPDRQFLIDTKQCLVEGAASFNPLRSREIHFPNLIEIDMALFDYGQPTLNGSE